MNLKRPASIDFNHVTGAVLTVPPVTRGQMRRVFALDQTPTENPAEQLQRRAAMFDILLEGAAARDAAGAAVEVQAFLETLTTVEETQILNAIIAQHHGIDPQLAADTVEALAEIAKKKILSGLENSSPTTTGTP